jgi:WD40 repeat protein
LPPPVLLRSCGCSCGDDDDEEEDEDEDDDNNAATTSSDDASSRRRRCCCARTETERRDAAAARGRGLLFGSPPAIAPSSSGGTAWRRRRRSISGSASSSTDQEEEEAMEQQQPGAQGPPPQPTTAPPPSWQRRYGRKMGSLACWAGRYERDTLYGHGSAVRAARLLPSHGLLASSSADGAVRLWDLKQGMPLMVAPSSSSAPPGSAPTGPAGGLSPPFMRPCVSPNLGGTVRALALDARALVAGGADARLHVWLATATAKRGGGGLAAASASAWEDAEDRWCRGEDEANEDDFFALDDDDDAVAAASSSFSRSTTSTPLFDLPSGPSLRLTGHTGPVSALALTPEALFSGGWDYTVRVWRRGAGDDDDAAAPSAWPCVAALRVSDWVTSLAARGGRLLVAAGRSVSVRDTATGALLRDFQGLHEGGVAAVEGSHDGACLFTGGSEDGLLMRHDLRLRRPTVLVWHHSAPVTSLSLDDPWLLAGCADGTVAMYDVSSSSSSCSAGSAGGGGAGAASGSSPFSTSTTIRRRVLSGASSHWGAHGYGGAVACVDLRDGWACAAGEGSAVRTFDFTGAAAAAERAAAGRRGRRGGGGMRGQQQGQQQPQQQQQQGRRRRRGGRGGGGDGNGNATPALPVPPPPTTTAAAASRAGPSSSSLPAPPPRYLSSSAAAQQSPGRWHQLGGGQRQQQQGHRGAAGGLSLSASPSVVLARAAAPAPPLAPRPPRPPPRGA